MPPSYQLTDFAGAHLQAISFFLMILFASAKVIQWLWNACVRRLPPRLSYWKAVALVVLWPIVQRGAGHDLRGRN